MRCGLAAGLAVCTVALVGTSLGWGAAAPGAAGAAGRADATHRWVSVGPNNEKGNLAFTKARPSRVYVQSQLGTTVFRSDDRGGSWTRSRGIPVNTHEAGGVAASQVDPDVVYATVVGEDNGHGYVLRSSDAGKTFKVALDVPAAVNQIVSSDSGRLFVAAEAGVYTSSDDARGWRLLPGSPAHARLARLEGGDLFVAAGSDVHVIRRALTRPQPAVKLARPGGVTSALLQLTVNGRAMVVRSGFSAGYLSTDRGAHWRRLKWPGPALNTLFFAGISDSGELRIQAGESGKPSVQRVSRDLGKSWKEESGIDKVDVYQDFGTFPDRPDDDVVAGAAGIYTTEDHRSFRRIGVPGGRVLSLTTAVGASGPALVAGTLSGSYRSTAPLRTELPPRYQDWSWTGQAPHTFGNRISALATDPGHRGTVYRVRNACDSNPCFYLERSTDAGLNWKTVQPEVPGTALAISVHPRTPKRLYIATHSPSSVYTSDDGGATLDRHDQKDLGGFTSLSVDPRNVNTAWIGGPEGLFRTTDGGRTLKRVRGGPVTAVAVDPRNADHLVVAGQTSISRSTDGGKTFTVGTKVRSGTFSGLAFSGTGAVYASSRDGDSPGVGVLRSTDGGRSWKRITGNLPDSSVMSVAVSPDGSWVYAGTESGSAYRLRTRA